MCYMPKGIAEINVKEYELHRNSRCMVAVTSASPKAVVKARKLGVVSIISRWGVQI